MVKSTVDCAPNANRLIYAAKLQKEFSVLCQLQLFETASFKWHAMKAAEDNMYQSPYEMMISIDINRF